MNDTKTTTTPPDADKPKEVLTRFRPSELEIMKADTGTERDGSAVAAYARKRLREQAAKETV